MRMTTFMATSKTSRRAPAAQVGHEQHCIPAEKQFTSRIASGVTLLRWHLTHGFASAMFSVSLGICKAALPVAPGVEASAIFVFQIT